LERAADEEEAQTGDILRLPVAETYQNLPIKVRQHTRWRTHSCAWQPPLVCTLCSIAQVLVHCDSADVTRRLSFGDLAGLQCVLEGVQICSEVARG
jgi:hypothetical protein